MLGLTRSPNWANSRLMLRKRWPVHKPRRPAVSPPGARRGAGSGFGAFSFHRRSAPSAPTCPTPEHLSAEQLTSTAGDGEGFANARRDACGVQTTLAALFVNLEFEVFSLRFRPTRPSCPKAILSQLVRTLALPLSQSSKNFLQDVLSRLVILVDRANRSKKTKTKQKERKGRT